MASLECHVAFRGLPTTRQTWTTEWTHGGYATLCHVFHHFIKGPTRYHTGINSLGTNVQDWSPHVSFVLKGSQVSAFQLKGWFKSKMSIQEYRNENTKLVLNLCMNYMVHVSSTTWRIKNRPYNFTSCSDNALRLLVFMTGRLYWELQVTSSFQFVVAFWRVVLREVYFEGAKPHLKGIEDFNLKHCLQLSKMMCWK